MVEGTAQQDIHPQAGVLSDSEATDPGHRVSLSPVVEAVSLHRVSYPSTRATAIAAEVMPHTFLSLEEHKA
jgi:hypothetical protein